MTRRLPSARTTTRRINDIAYTLDRLGPDTLAELRRIAGESPKPLEEGAGLGHHDGYPPGGDHQPGAKGDHADPTFARTNQPARDDRTGDAICDIHDELRTIHRSAVRISHLLDFALGAANDQRGRVTALAGDCAACRRAVAGTPNDKLISGYCAACRKAWERAGYPDRGEFAATRRRDLEQRDGDAA